MTLSEELEWRGFVNQTTLANITDLDKQARTFYHGYDASADSLTVGNLAGLMVDKVFARHGYKTIILAGGATSLIGDPGGKDSERPLQDESAIAANIEGVKAQISRIFEGQEFTLVNNLDWTKDLTVLQFLRDVGKHFSMSNLIQRDYIARRLGEGGAGISYTEFSYSLLQGMDFLHLYDKYGCTLQVGSSDQWSNCLSGIDLVRRARGQEVHVVTHPLVINKVTGKKFGKSEDGAVWLDSTRTSPTQFYQFWVNTDDEAVEDHLKVYATLTKDETEQIIEQHRQKPSDRVAQIRLAHEVTRLIHGEEATKNAETATGLLTGSVPVDQADDTSLQILRSEQPSLNVQSDSSIIDALVKSGLASSNTEARRLLQDNAISVNGQKVNRENFEASDFRNDRLLLRKGKKFKDTALVEL
jgi:tyrosyl-tRNA synthetase